MRLSTKLMRLALAPLTLVVLFFIFDAVIPYVIRQADLFEMPVVSWRPKMGLREYYIAFRYYFFSILLISIGYFVGARLGSLGFKVIGDLRSFRGVSRGRTWTLLFFSFLVCLFLFMLKTWQYGSWGEVFEKRWLGKSDGVYSGPIDFVRSLAIELVFICVGILIFSRHSTALGLSSFVAILIGWITASTTLSRGTQIGFFLGLMAMFAHDPLYLKRIPTRKAMPLHFFLASAVICGLISFVGYGVIRQKSYTVSVVQDETFEIIDAVKSNLLQFVRGDGLDGLTAILYHYDSKCVFLNGRTIIDSLLLPIPRLLWAEKPSWYGIDTITRAMGWPTTTQSAVTIAGEGYANFGPVGIGLALILGGVLGVMAHLRKVMPFMAIYCFVLLPGIFTTMWMSTIGFINSYFRVPILAVVVMLCCWRKKTQKVSCYPINGQ
jgi:hypothetical protein